MTPDDRSLILDYLSDDLTAEELSGLLVRLKTEPDLTAQLLSMAGDEARLVEWARSAALVEANALNATPEAPVGRGSRADAARRFGRRQLDPVSTFFIGAAATAATILAVSYWHASAPLPIAIRAVPAPETRVEATDTVARIVNESSDSDWYTESHLHRDRWSLHRGDTVRLNKGSVRIVFEHGTSLTLLAPAVFEVQDAMRTRIHRGAIRVVVAKGAEGFSVVTPIARVVDLGTEFGVSVNDRGGTDVVVFEGAVDVEGRANEIGPPGVTKRLNAGEAVRMDERGTASRLVTVESKNYPAGAGQSLELTLPARPPVIERVWDNTQRVDNYSFYEIVHAGMAEDALAFVDRPNHQWNGLEVSGMPDYLIGADYVRTFNDDKLSRELQISLKVSCAADIYLLLDDRTAAPEWMKAEFERTDDRIGLDEGTGRYRDLAPDGSTRWIQRPTGVGPGVSIDQTFSIWKRSVDGPGEVLLGPLSGPDWDVNMYGIIAAPRGS